MELARAEDPERSELRDMLTAWSDVFGVGSEHRLTLADVIETATKDDGRLQFKRSRAPGTVCSGAGRRVRRNRQAQPAG